MPYYAASERLCTKDTWLQRRWRPAGFSSHEVGGGVLSPGWWLPVWSCDLQYFIALFSDVDSLFTALLLINILS